MTRRRDHRLFRIGLALVVIGSGPLLVILLMATIGLWPDRNPNPIGRALLAMLSFWPSLMLLATGA